MTNEKDWFRALKYFDEKCAYCGQPPKPTDQPFSLHRDHCIPISRKGPRHFGNIVPACPECNFSKGDRDLDEWLNWRFSESAESVRLRLTHYFRSIGYEYPKLDPSVSPRMRYKTKRLKITVPEDYATALTSLSKQTGVLEAVVVREALKDYFAKHGISVEGKVQWGQSRIPETQYRNS